MSMNWHSVGLLPWFYCTSSIFSCPSYSDLNNMMQPGWQNIQQKSKDGNCKIQVNPKS